MSRAKAGTALATTGDGAVATKKQITETAARDMLRKLATDRYREARDVANQNLREAEKTVGGQTKQLDRSVLDQGRAWMTRIALIARRNAGDGYNTSKVSVKLQSVAGKIAAIVGELEAVIITDVQIGLFGRVEKDDFLDQYGGNYGGPIGVISKKNKTLRKEAEELLEGYEITPDPAKKGRGSRGVVLHDPVADDMEAEEDEEPEDDEE